MCGIWLCSRSLSPALDRLRRSFKTSSGLRVNGGIILHRNASLSMTAKQTWNIYDIILNLSCSSGFRTMKCFCGKSNFPKPSPVNLQLNLRHLIMSVKSNQWSGRPKVGQKHCRINLLIRHFLWFKTLGKGNLYQDRDLLCFAKVLQLLKQLPLELL